MVPHYMPTTIGEDMKKKSRRRGRGTGASESTPWSTLTGAELWNMVCKDAAETYNISDILGYDQNTCLFSHHIFSYGQELRCNCSVL